MSGIYIHIPFCSKRCGYCDFYLITNLKVMDKFLGNLKTEISLSRNEFKHLEFDSVFFGGGTPSVLSGLQINDILNHLHKNFNVSSGSEITMEANPEDFLGKDPGDYRSAGVNRLSLGVQSFIDRELKFLTRQHSAEEAETVVKKAKKYFDNVNLDIIYSLPSQTISDTDHSLSKAIELDADHISAYTLTFEERTPLYKSLLKNLVKKNPDNVEAELFNFVSEKLIAGGYEHYEVSNFASDGHRCRHNLKYWSYDNYIGFGPSAHSFADGTRWNNYRDITKYNSLLEEGKLPLETRYQLSDEQKKLEFIMLSLRSSGINYEKYHNLFNEDFTNKFSHSINEMVKNDLAVNENGRFRLTERGFAIADEIIAKYF